jgi:hypothetical protein
LLARILVPELFVHGQARALLVMQFALVAFPFDFTVQARPQRSISHSRAHGVPPWRQYAQAGTPGMFELSHIDNFNGRAAMFARALSARVRHFMLAP